MQPVASINSVNPCFKLNLRMVHPTRGIVLRTVKYGETSVVATLFTEKFGLQTYLVNGVRSSGKSGKYMQFQPAAQLRLAAYHHPQKNMQRIRESEWDVLTPNLFADVVRNSIALFSIEVTLRSLKQPEENPELYEFLSNYLQRLNEADAEEIANYPLYFLLNLPHHLGFGLMQNNRSLPYLDLEQGVFVAAEPAHHHFIGGDDAQYTAALLKASSFSGVSAITLSNAIRSRLLDHYLMYLALHLPDFGTLRSLDVLREVMR